jgi:hypothetical protein
LDIRVSYKTCVVIISVIIIPIREIRLVVHIIVVRRSIVLVGIIAIGPIGLIILVGVAVIIVIGVGMMIWVGVVLVKC